MRHQVQLHDPSPLDIVISVPVSLGFFIDQSRRFDAGDNEVAELAGLALRQLGGVDAVEADLELLAVAGGAQCVGVMH